MISRSVLSRVIALVHQVVAEGRQAMVTGDALLSSTLGIGAIDRGRIAAALDGEFDTKLPDHEVEAWTIVSDIALSVEKHAGCA